MHAANMVSYHMTVIPVSRQSSYQRDWGTLDSLVRTRLHHEYHHRVMHEYMLCIITQSMMSSHR